MARKATSEDRREFVSRQRGQDPTLRQKTYTNDLLNYTNYHNKNTDSKVLRKWAVDYVSTIDKKKAPLVNKASDFELRSIGMMGHAIMRGDYVSQEHVTRIGNDITTLFTKYKEVVEEKKQEQAAVVVPVVDKSSVHIAEANGAIDEWILKGTAFSMKDYLVANNVTSPVAKSIGQFFTRLEAELTEAVEGKDPQLKEGYAYLGKVKMKKFLVFVQQLIADCQQQIVAAKVQRKPRARKEKPANVLVSKLKFLREYAELTLKSEEPKSIVGAQQVWFYDVERRKLACYTAEKGKTLTVKGTTILGWDVSESSAKTLRKPEELVKGNLAKRTLNANYNGLKTKAQAVNGRTNENMIILKVF
jgi:hypothetical protein